VGATRWPTANLFPLPNRLLGYDAVYYLAAHNPKPLSQAQLGDQATLLKAIGHTVERHGQDRDIILALLPNVLGTMINEDHVAMVDVFITCPHLPVVASGICFVWWPAVWSRLALGRLPYLHTVVRPDRYEATERPNVDTGCHQSFVVCATPVESKVRVSHIIVHDDTRHSV
jgi:hypothetical protein